MRQLRRPVRRAEGRSGLWAMVVVPLAMVAASGVYAAPPAASQDVEVTVYGTALQPAGKVIEVIAPSEAVELRADLYAKQIRLEPLDATALMQEDARQTDDSRLRVGVVRDLPPISAADGTWHEIPGMGRLWVLCIISQDAYEIRVHFSKVNIPEGGELYLHVPDSDQAVERPYGGTGLYDHGRFWSGSFIGDMVVVEYLGPAEDDASELPFVIDQVTHDYTDVVFVAGLREGGCHNDVQCYYPGWENISNSVARIKVIDNPWMWYCTASLMDTVAGDETPYLLTAGHCVENQDQAESMTARWKYESTYCDSGEGVSVYSCKASSGADLLYRNTSIDVSLCMLQGRLWTDVVPYYWSGWSSATVPTGTDFTCISHPDAAYKRITFGLKIGSSGYNKHNISWTSGTIESGSSGSGVWREDLGGKLYAGTASTSVAPIGCSNPDGPSQYGRFDRTYPYVSSYLAEGSDDDLEDNDSCAGAVAVSPGTYGTRVVKRLDEDWYRITAPTCHQVDIDLIFNTLHGNIDAELYDGCGGSVVASATSTNNNEYISYLNETGAAVDYVLRVYLAQDTRNEYDLTVTISDECEFCTATAARSCKDHGGATLCLDLGLAGGIEPRSGGIAELEMDLDSASGFQGGVGVECSTTWSGTAGGVADGDTVTVTFDPPLPDEAYCTITLDCTAQVCVRGCEGDLNRDGATNSTDASQVKLRFGQTASSANCEWDFDLSGEVNTTDYSQIKLRFGRSAPECP